MARITTDELKEIITTSVATASLQVFINAASLVVTEHLGSDTTLSAAQLKDIERFLAAHMLACTMEQQVKSRSVKDARDDYQGVTAMGLNATFYGQNVLLLDTTGILANVVGRRQASIHAVTSFS